VAEIANPIHWGTVQEAAEFFGVATITIRRWISAGQIEAKRVGPKLIRVNLNSLNDLGTDLQIGGR
jgi:excisionase family DNA binding protein